MPLQYAAGLALAWFVWLYPVSVFAEAGHPITLLDALRRALAANPRLTAAEKDVRIAARPSFVRPAHFQIPKRPSSSTMRSVPANCGG